ncbi:MAG: ABC transporter permease [Bdellovibrionales bacterium]|nr:ABC transporter permease [Bdellovibrionales bacterium]
MKRLSLFAPLISVFIGLALSLLLVVALGESPILVMKVLANGAVGSATSFGYSLFYATPLIFTGLSVWWSLRAGLFNIGAEGQMTVGGAAMAVVGIVLSSLPSWLAWPLALLAGFGAGAVWGYIVAWFKIRRGTHELLTSILLNFVSYGVAGVLFLHVFRNPSVQTPETLEVRERVLVARDERDWWLKPVECVFRFCSALRIRGRRGDAEIGFGLRTRWVGSAPEFARRTGVATSRQTMMALVISGGLAGLAGASMILGYAHKAREGFSSGAGFVGIAVALLGGRRAIGVLLAALLFGALQKGALDLDLDTEKISRDLAVVIQALVVIAVATKSWLEAKRWNS